MRGLARGTIALLLVAAAVGIAGCGGGDSETTLSKAEFIKQANQACRQGETERLEAVEGTAKKLKVEPGELPTPGEEKKIMLAALAGYEKSTQKLKELVPSDQAEQLAPLIEAREGVAKQVHENADSITPSEVEFKKANLLAGEYGLEDCQV